MAVYTDTWPVIDAKYGGQVVKVLNVVVQPQEGASIVSCYVHACAIVQVTCLCRFGCAYRHVPVSDMCM